MTSNEFQMLCVGIALGSQFTSVLYSWQSSRTARSAAAVAKAARKRQAGEHFYTSLHLYRLQHRSPV